MEVATEVDLTLNHTSDLTVIFTLNDPSGRLLSQPPTVNIASLRQTVSFQWTPQ